MGTVIVLVVLVVIVAAIVYTMVKGKKNGKHSCGGDCGHCGGSHTARLPTKSRTTIKITPHATS